MTLPLQDDGQTIHDSHWNALTSQINGNTSDISDLKSNQSGSSRGLWVRTTAGQVPDNDATYKLPFPDAPEYQTSGISLSNNTDFNINNGLWLICVSVRLVKGVSVSGSRQMMWIGAPGDFTIRYAVGASPLTDFQDPVASLATTLLVTSGSFDFSVYWYQDTGSSQDILTDYDSTYISIARIGPV